MIDVFAYRGREYDVSEIAPHGSPFDRGSADSYYHRPLDPHWYPEGTRVGATRIEKEDMTSEQIDEYYAGYVYNEDYGDKKEW